MVDVKAFFDNLEDSIFDIRRTKYLRFVDQKCTPDIVCFVADCILTTECATRSFTKSDLWHTNYFKEFTRVVYGKPYADNKGAAKEYDKIASQPLTLLSCAQVLSRTKEKNAWVYTIKNPEMLEYIALREQNTYNFLLAFFTKVINASGMARWFHQYKKECESDVSEAHKTLYARFRKFSRSIKENRTDSEKENESDRILHKILNVLAYDGQYAGSNEKIPTWTDLMYNKLNKRDSHKKKKSLTREEFAKLEAKEINQNFFIKYQVEKAKRKVHKKQGAISEVQDDLANGVASNVHHIFSQSQYPTIASYYENLILLTANQHYQKAHPDHNTQIVDTTYQYVCLMAKSHTIEDSIINKGEDFYSKDKFIDVINTGLNDTLNIESSFDDIRTHLTYVYIQQS